MRTHHLKYIIIIRYKSIPPLMKASDREFLDGNSLGSPEYGLCTNPTPTKVVNLEPTRNCIVVT